MKPSPADDSIISIVTPSFNQAEFIDDTIRSVLSQSGNFYIDYIINDGGSTDQSVRIIQSYERLLRQNCDVAERAGLEFFISKSRDFPWNRCSGISYRWVSERDEGQADALNKGLYGAKGSVAAFINSDDVYYPGAFRKVLGTDWSEADFIYGKGMWISRDGRDLLYYPTFKPTKYSLYFQCTLCQPTVFFSKETFLRLGKFAIDYQCAFDYEYWLRAISQNCVFRYINRPLACSRMYESNKSLSERSLVADEVAKLKSQYYGQCDEQLHRIPLWVSKLTVQRQTVRRVKKLNHLLQRLG
jgi:glycosyltransferase involved in cell wall biosynthesis